MSDLEQIRKRWSHIPFSEPWAAKDVRELFKENDRLQRRLDVAKERDVVTELDTLGHGVKERLQGIRECWGVDEEMDESDMQMMGEDFVAARHDFAFMFDQLAKAEYRYREVKEINQNKGVVMSRSNELSQLGSRLAAAQSREEISTEKQEPTECQKIHLLTPTGERTWSEVIIRVPQNVRIEVRRLRE